MKRLIGFFICLLIVLSLMACSSSDTEQPASETQVLEEQVVEAIVYAEDEVVNQFITDYNAISQSAFTDISKGSIRTKYFAYSYGYYCELLNVTDTEKICVTIAETNDNAELGVAGMRDVFHDIVKTIDSSLTDEDVYGYFDELIANGLLKEDDVLGNMVISFSPDKDLSSGHSRGHIRIVAQ